MGTVQEGAEVAWTKLMGLVGEGQRHLKVKPTCRPLAAGCGARRGRGQAERRGDRCPRAAFSWATC